MFTVGMLGEQNQCSTLTFSDLEEAKATLKRWRDSFLNNNYVVNRVTTIVRDNTNSITHVKEVLETSHHREWILFLSKNG